MESTVISKIKENIDLYRKDREKQIKHFAPFAKDILITVMQDKKTDKEDIKSLFDIFNARRTPETVKLKISNLKVSKDKIKEWISYFEKIEDVEGGRGYAGVASQSFKGFDDKGADKIKEVLCEIEKIPESYNNINKFSEAVKGLYEVYGMRDVLTVWLNYLKPTIFPITNYPGRRLFSSLGYHYSILRGFSKPSIESLLIESPLFPLRVYASFCFFFVLFRMAS